MPVALAIGKFDALHLGHRALIDAAVTHAQPALLSFTGMAEILGWEARSSLLTASERQRVLSRWSQELGQSIETIDVPFRDVRSLQPAEFIAYLQQRYDVAAVVTGENFRFGFNRSGDVQTLRQLGVEQKFAVETVASVSVNGTHASSSRIREAIEAGDCPLATALLGRPYTNTGVVRRGDGRGQQLGFPTANMHAIENLIPKPGVYAADVVLKGTIIRAAMNIGYLPSIGDQRPLSVEAHLLDWSGDCYDQELRIEWMQRIRDEMKFNSLDELKTQIGHDIEVIRRL